jgi:cytochrome c oxidase assembly protein subunit 15
MHGEFFPKVLIDSSLWTIDNVIHYERGLVPGLVQFMHRLCAYFIFITALILLWKIFARNDTGILRKSVVLFNVIVLLQISLGILTVINSIGRTPLVLGVAHQGMAIILLTSLVYIHRNIHK